MTGVPLPKRFNAGFLVCHAGSATQIVAKQMGYCHCLFQLTRNSHICCFIILFSPAKSSFWRPLRYRLVLSQSVPWAMELWLLWPINSAVIYIISWWDCSLGRNLIKLACASHLSVIDWIFNQYLLSNLRNAGVCTEPVLQYNMYSASSSVPSHLYNNFTSRS